MTNVSLRVGISDIMASLKFAVGGNMTGLNVSLRVGASGSKTRPLSGILTCLEVSGDGGMTGLNGSLRT